MIDRNEVWFSHILVVVGIVGLGGPAVLLANATFYGQSIFLSLSLSSCCHILNYQAIAWKNQDDYERGGYKMLVNTHKEVRVLIVLPPSSLLTFDGSKCQVWRFDILYLFCSWGLFPMHQA
jgi:hypothetical protein